MIILCSNAIRIGKQMSSASAPERWATSNSEQWVMDRVLFLFFSHLKNKCALRRELAFASCRESWRSRRERGRGKKAVTNVAKGRTKAARACTLEH